MSQKKDSKGRNLRQNENQMKDGRYRYRYTDRDGNRKAIYAWKLVKTDKTPNGKKEDICLREKELQLQKDLSDGIDVYAGETTTVYELIMKYIDTKTMIVPTTRTNYINITNKNIKPNRLGKMKIVNVRKSDVKLFYAYLRNEREFSTNTIQLYQNLIFPAFQMAVDDFMIRVNPAKDCMKEYVRGSLSSTRKPLSREEQKVLLDYVKSHCIYSVYYPMIAFMISTGCRISETLGLTWNDIDLKQKFVNVNHQLINKKVEGKPLHFIAQTKNKTNRIIPLQDDIIEIMRDYKRKTYFNSISSGCEIEGYTNFVFLNRENKFHKVATLVRAFHGIRDSYNKSKDVDEIELPDFTPHTLRHTACTRYAENGMDPKVLQMIMGHKNIAITMQVYNHADNIRISKETQRVSSPLVV